MQLYVKNNILKAKEIADVLRDGLTGRLDLEFLKRGLVTEEDNARVYSELFKLQYVNLESINVNPAVVEMVSADFAAKYGIVPIYIADGVTYVAISDPFAYDDLKKINSFVKGKHELVVTTRTQI